MRLPFRNKTNNLIERVEGTSLVNWPALSPEYPKPPSAEELRQLPTAPPQRHSYDSSI